jgi:hypothetical protein
MNPLQGFSGEKHSDITLSRIEDIKTCYLLLEGMLDVDHVCCVFRYDTGLSKMMRNEDLTQTTLQEIVLDT